VDAQRIGAGGTVVVVGAGLAGVTVAATLREQGFDGRIALVGAEDRLPYDRPPLSKAALLDDPCPSDEPLRPEGFYDDHGMELRLGVAVSALDTAAGEVELADGARIEADAVVLATGGVPRVLDVPGAGLTGVCTLRTSEDAARIRAQLQRGVRVAVVGGGFIGTEVAAAAVARDCPTVVLEAADLPMLRALGPDVATRLVETHRERGVEVRTGVGVAGFGGTGVVDRVELTDGTHVLAELVVVGVGMVPDTGLAGAAGLAVGDGVLVDRTGRTSNPAVWAAGDVAAVEGPAGHVRTEHWQHAKDQGAAVALALLGQAPNGVSVPWFWSDQYDLNIQLAGSPAADDARVWRGEPDALSFSVLHHRDGVLTGITAVNRGRDVRPAIELIRRGSVLDVELLADPAVTVKALLKAGR
jgi:3-phenylpropionate/trans-cinnamate dioxygenase ferredoxin reductase subunit